MFSAEKILQEIVYLLSLNNNRMNLLKLMKELYLIDRESINERDVSVSGDVFCSMPHGPVLSTTLGMLYELTKNNWGYNLESVEAKYYPDIQIKKGISYNRLSVKDRKYIETISEKFKDFSPKELENYTHTLKEWVDPRGSSLKIRYRDVMLALGKTEKEISEAKKEYEMVTALSSFGA